jgi:hypothetical protein
MANLFFKGRRESVLLTLSSKCPTESGGILAIPFKARYRCPSTDECREFREGLKAETVTDDDLVNKLVIGWEGVKDDKDEPIPFSEETLREALQFVPYRIALVEGAIQMAFGKEALENLRQKNSRKPGSGG